MGPAASGDVDQGPLINDRARIKVEQHVHDALGRGARLLTGGKRHRLGGNFYEPTVLGEANPSMRLASEETFGPVAPVVAKHLHDFGAGYALWAGNGGVGVPANNEIVAGVRDFNNVGVVVVGAVVDGGGALVSGVKESGLGREGSKYGLEDYQHLKYLCMGGLSA